MKLIAWLPDPEREAAFTDVIQISGEERRWWAIIEGISPLQGDAQRSAFEQVLPKLGPLKGACERAEIVAELAAHLPRSLIGPAVQAAIAMDSDHYRKRAFAALAKRIAYPSEAEHELENLVFAREMLWSSAQRSRRAFSSDLAVIVPMMTRQDSSSVSAQMLDAALDVFRWWS